jgi:hypothetical protein
MPRRTAAPLPRFSGWRMSVSMRRSPELLEHGARAVARAVVDADQLDVEGHEPHAVDGCGDGALLVVDGHDDAQPHVRRLVPVHASLIS